MDSKLSDKGNECKVYRRRWLMIIIFMIYCFNGAMQWAQYTVITHLVTKYYNVSSTSVEWTANIFTLGYIIFIIPSLEVITRMGVRRTMILGAIGIAIGNWIKVAAVVPDKFYLVMIGQGVSATCLMLTFGLLGRFIALWFPVSEISVAGVLPFLGDQLGAACAFLLPSNLVKDGSIDDIGNGMRTLQFIIAGMSTVILFLVVFFFKDKPKLPPSMSQAKKKEVKTEKVSSVLMNLAKNKAFILYTISFGLNSAPYIAIAVLLNELLLINFPERVSDAGNIGFLMMICGMVGSIIIGKIQDKTQKYKECAVFLTICSNVCMIMFTLALKSNNILFVYIVAGFQGFFLLSLMSNGIQLGLEITYPAPEHISTTVLFFLMQVLVLLMTVAYGFIIKLYGDLASNIAISILYVIASVLIILVPSDMKRSQAESDSKKAEMASFLNNKESNKISAA